VQDEQESEPDGASELQQSQEMDNEDALLDEIYNLKKQLVASEKVGGEKLSTTFSAVQFCDILNEIDRLHTMIGLCLDDPIS
jgi:hypothetical protein